MFSSNWPPKISYPLYLTNGEQLGKNKHTMIIRILENRGVSHLKAPKKIQIWWGHTCKPRGVGHFKTPKTKHKFGGDTCIPKP